jgi:MFS family permease
LLSLIGSSAPSLATNVRSNIGYASVQGLNTDIGLTGNQFNVATSIFYVTYVCIETPAAIFVKSAKFSRMIPAIAMAWGLVCMCTGFIQNYAGLLVTRLLLGAAEGGLFPSLTLYLMSWYRRDELAKRMCFLFGTLCLEKLLTTRRSSTCRSVRWAHCVWYSTYGWRSWICRMALVLYGESWS